MKLRLFDFILDSDVPFPELQRASGPATLTVRRDPRRSAPAGLPPALVRRFPPDARHPWLAIGRLPDGAIRFDFAETLSVRYADRVLLWRRRRGCGDASFRHVVLDHALPFVAAHEGRTVLHGACVALERRAILIAGPAGAGKSTLAASFGVGRGPDWTVRGDDAAVVTLTRSAVMVTPEYPGLRLWPDSAGALGFARGVRVSHRSRKRRFAPPTPSGGGLPLDGIFVVVPAARDGRTAIRELALREAVIALLANAFVLDPADRARAAAHLERLSALAARVPVCELRVPRRFDALDRARMRIERHLAGVA